MSGQPSYILRKIQEFFAIWSLRSDSWQDASELAAYAMPSLPELRPWQIGTLGNTSRCSTLRFSFRSSNVELTKTRNLPTRSQLPLADAHGGVEASRHSPPVPQFRADAKSPLRPQLFSDPTILGRGLLHVEK